MFPSVEALDTMTYKDPMAQKSAANAKVSYVHVPKLEQTNDKLMFQMSEDEKTNTQKIIFGLSTPLPGQDSSKRSLDLTIESPELLLFLKELDRKNVEATKKNKESWFKKPPSDAEIDHMYIPLVKENGEYKESVKIKIRCEYNATNIYIVDEQKNNSVYYSNGNLNHLEKNAKVMVIVETPGLWFINKQFGMSLNASQILVWPAKHKTGLASFTFKNGHQALPSTNLE